MDKYSRPELRSSELRPVAVCCYVGCGKDPTGAVERQNQPNIQGANSINTSSFLLIPVA